ncbi:MAG: LysR family transcriptional regulator [Bdellovibrionales bacterium]|nr:LysR family transcriptional regulator [Bdellovibrionales bacterium]
MNSKKSLNYNHLKHFHAVATEGSISAAADTLSLSQSTLSEQISSLEEFFGEELFERKAVGLKLNNKGRKVYRYTKIIFSTGDKLLHVFRNPKADAISIDVGVTSSISRSIAANFFTPLFLDKELYVRLKQADYDYLLMDMTSGKLDILLSDLKVDTRKHEVFASEPIFSNKLVFVCSVNSTLSKLDFPKDFDEKPFLNYSVFSGYRWAVDNELRNLGITPSELGEVDDISVIRSAIDNGICFGVLPYSSVRKGEISERFKVLGEIDQVANTIYASFLKKDPSDHVMKIIDRLKSMEIV